MDFNLDEFEIDDITPAPKKKRKADGGQKGKRGERELCKIFTERFGKEFTRTIGSGNRWSQVASMPTHAKNTFTGDICTPEGFLFSLESKNGYEDKINLGHLFSSRNKTLDGFLKQSIKEAKDCDRIPLMCWKRKRQPWVAFINAEDLGFLFDRGTHLVYKTPNINWVCIALDKLLELPDSFFFKQSKSVSKLGSFGKYKVIPSCTVETSNAPEIKEFVPSKKKKLIVGSLFSNDSPEQQKWLELQLEWLKSTTDDFDHVIRLTEPSERFSKITNVLIDKYQDHFSGLRFLSKFFKKHQDYYENFLFIDSDAFPVQKDWLTILTDQMVNHEIATVVRYENLEQRLHASVLFAKKIALNQLEFPIIKHSIPDLLGRDDNDVVITPYELEKRDLAFPLLRSNKKELHPLLCGVYYNLFYHHGCGSRIFNMRSKDYWDHVVVDTDVQGFTDKLMENPNKFIKSLVWNNVKNT